jgi:hypothetical protein
MNLIQVKEIKDIKTGVKNDKPWTKTFFIGVLEDGTERGISTFHAVKPNTVYQMELQQRTWNNKIYWNAEEIKPFEENTAPPEPPKSPPKEKQPTKLTQTSAPPPTTNYRTEALKCALIYYGKFDSHLTEKDVIFTANIFLHYLETGQFKDE